MGSAENFCLRWNDFESNVSGSFRELRAESDFFDISLACNDNGGKSLQAHKVILSASSPFFKQMLRNINNNPNPMIYLRGIRFADLENVLDFVYHGEVNVAQDDLNSFLAVAEDLQIKGLTQSSTQSSLGGGTGGKKLARKIGMQSSSGAKRSRKDDSLDAVKNEPDLSQAAAASTVDDLEQYDDPTYVTYEAGNAATTSAAADEHEIMDAMEQPQDTKAVGDSATVTDLNDLVVGLMTYDTESKSLTCNLCGKKSPWRTTMLRHIEANHVETAGHVCDICGQVCKTRHAFGMHKRRKHGLNMSNQPLPIGKQNSQQQQQPQEQPEQQIVVTETENDGQIVTTQQVVTAVSTATIVVPK